MTVPSGRMPTMNSPAFLAAAMARLTCAWVNDADFVIAQSKQERLSYAGGALYGRKMACVAAGHRTTFKALGLARFRFWRTGRHAVC